MHFEMEFKIKIIEKTQKKNRNRFNCTHYSQNILEFK